MFKYLILATCLSLETVCFANTQVLVISGGDDPGLNHYSQYLQTKTVYTYLANLYGVDKTALYFGAGNNPDTQNPLLDVHQIIQNGSNKKDKNDHMLSGIIPHNQAATKTNIYNYLFSSTVYNLTNKDNLLIFVSDHGMPNEYLDEPNPGRFSNNCIDLWNFNGELVNNWLDKAHFSKTCLSKNDLGTLLDNIKAKHIVFEMSQCYSGGFHQMSVSMQNGYPQANPHICGFTAVPPDHYASGCTADADGPGYQGYERSFTEWFTGVSIPTGKILRRSAPDMLTAHQDAILEDMTGDEPITTSDYYLMQWALVFNSPTYKSRVTNFTATQTKEIFNSYKKYLSGNSDKDLLRFNHLVKQDQEKIISQYPQYKEFFSLSLVAQGVYINRLQTKMDELDYVRSKNEEGLMHIYLNLIYPQWMATVRLHNIPNFTAIEYQMESNLYAVIIDKGLMSATYQYKMLYLQYLALNHNNPDIVKYNHDRMSIIEAHAKANNNQALLNAVKYYKELADTMDNNQDIFAEQEKEKQLLKRIYTYNQVMAAWVTLQQINDVTALKELSGLLECEHTK